MFRRMQRSWQLTKQSAAVLARNQVLLLFPLMSGMATIILLASFLAPLLWHGDLQAHSKPTATTYLALFLFYLLSYFVSIFFNCALMGSANMAFAGGRANLRDGLGLATARLGNIVMWTLVTATVGLVMRTLEERAGRLFAQIVIALLGSAWTILTYFIVPIIVFEDIDVFAGVKRSAALVKKTWGEEIGKAASFGVLMLFGIVAWLVLGIGCVMADPLFGLAVMFISFILLLLIATTLDGIFKVALYRYACWGTVPQGFSPELVQSAFTPKKKGKFGF